MKTRSLPGEAEQVARQTYEGFAAGDFESARSEARGLSRARSARVLDRTRQRIAASPASSHLVLLVTRSPGIDDVRARKAGDMNFHVLTIKDGKIVAVRVSRDRDEALGLVGTAPAGSS